MKKSRKRSTPFQRSPPARQLCFLFFYERLLHAAQSHFAHQSRSGRNIVARTVVTISQVSRNIHFPLIAGLHGFERDLPALNNSVDWKFCRFTASITAVEHRAVDQPSFVVHHHRARSGGRRPATRLQHLVEQSSTQGFHSGIFCGFGQKSLARFSVFHHEGVFGTRRSGNLFRMTILTTATATMTKNINKPRRAGCLPDFEGVF